MKAVALLISSGVTLSLLTGCSSSDSTADSKAAGSPSSAPSSASKDASAPAGLTMSGDLSGTMAIRLCTDSGVASLEVSVKGDDMTYNGSISATQIGFVGPAAAAFALQDGSAKPTVSSDGNSFTVKDATLVDLINKKTVTVTGVVNCP